MGCTDCTVPACAALAYDASSSSSSLQVSVQWETVALSADASDFSPTGGTVTFPPQSSSLTLPLVVNDDPTPEFDEQFEVRLVGVGGGARLGDTDVAVVTILASDDPNGALGKWRG